MERNPFDGIGKPEPLKGDLSGLWSRRIDDVNRLVYRIKEGRLEIISCRGHYDDWEATGFVLRSAPVVAERASTGRAATTPSAAQIPCQLDSVVLTNKKTGDTLRYLRLFVRRGDGIRTHDLCVPKIINNAEILEKQGIYRVEIKKSFPLSFLNTVFLWILLSAISWDSFQLTSFFVSVLLHLLSLKSFPSSI